MSRRWKVLAVTSAGGLLGFLDVTIVNIAFPAIERDFADSSRAALSWVLNGYNVVFAALLVPAGRLADLLGRRRVFLAGLASFTAVSALCALAPSAEALVAARVLQAASAAVMLPASLALLLREFPIAERATAVGLWGAAAALAAGIGPSLGGALIDVADWRLVFAVNIPIGAASLLAARRVLEESRDPAESGFPDLLGAAVLAAGVGAVALGIVKGEDWGWTSAPTLGSFAAGLVLVAAFGVRSLRHPVPVLDPRLFRIRSLAAANAGSFLFAVGFYGAILCNVLFLTSVWHYSVLEAGLAVTPAPVTAALFAGPAGKIADRLGHRVVIVPGVLAFVTALAWYALQVGTTPAFASEWLPGAVMWGVGVGLAFPTLGSAAVGALPAPRFGTGSAINMTARQLGAVLGVAMLVAIVGTPLPAEAPAAFDDGWRFCALAGAAAGLAALALGRRAERTPAEADYGAAVEAAGSGA